MDKIQLLRQRRTNVLAAGEKIRKTIAALTDEESFVELSGFSFSRSDFYEEGAEGEGIVTGFATIGGNPVYIAAQNFEVLHGGVSAANCAKLLRCLALAEKNSTPVVYVLHSLGVQIGEGVTALEGFASVLSKAAKLHGVVPQFAVIDGEVYGHSALLAACADFTFFMKEGVLAADSPLVLSAKSGKNLSKEEVGGAKALGATNLVSFVAGSYAEVRTTIAKILGVIPVYGAVVEENGEDLNAAFPALNKKCDADSLIKCVFDAGSYVEFGRECSPAVRCLIGRVGGISTAAVVFDGGDEGVCLDASSVAKVTSLVEFAAYYGLPLLRSRIHWAYVPTLPRRTALCLKRFLNWRNRTISLKTRRSQSSISRRSGSAIRCLRRNRWGSIMSMPLRTRALHCLKTQRVRRSNLPRSARPTPQSLRQSMRMRRQTPSTRQRTGMWTTSSNLRSSNNILWHRCRCC